MALNEIAFQRASRRELLEAWNYCKADRRANSPRRNVSDLNTTWDSLCHVFRRLNKQLPQFTTLVLQVSPSLLELHDLGAAHLPSGPTRHRHLFLSLQNSARHFLQAAAAAADQFGAPTAWTN